MTSAWPAALLALTACSFSGSPGAAGGDTDAASQPPDAMPDAAPDAMPVLVSALTVEAEDFTENIPRGGTTWTEETSRAGASGSYMVTDEIGVCEAGDCAELTFALPLEGPATYYAHFRAFAAGGGANTHHWWVDDGAPSVQDYDALSAEWQYRTQELGELGPGVHVLHVAKRDGIELDSITIDQNPVDPDNR